MRFSGMLLVVVFTIGVTSHSGAQLPVVDGLELWLDATDGSTVLDIDDNPAPFDEFVEVWKDKSPNAYEAFVDFENGAGSPLYQEAAINELPAIRFAGEFADGMLIDGLDLARPYTAFIVNQYWGDLRGRTLQSSDINWLLGLWSGQVSHYANGWVTTTRPNAETEVPYLVDTVGKEDNSSVFINGGNWTLDPLPNGTPGGLAIGGAGQFPAEVSDADVSEIVIYNRALENHELMSMRTYLMDKYAIEPFQDNPNAIDPNNIPDPDVMEVLKGTVSTFRTAADLDFSGEFVYGINVGGPPENDFFDPLVIGDVELVGGTNADESDLNDMGVTMTVANEINNWFAAAVNSFGEGTQDDDNLAFALQSIRWNTPPGIDIAMAVEEGESYKVQMLMGEACCDRGFDVTLEDELMVDNLIVHDLQDEGINDGTSAVAFTHEFVAGDDELNINLGGSVFGTPDNNPILHVLTLEKIDDLVVVVPGDCDGNGLLDAADLACVTTVADRDLVLGAIGSLPGDLDGNGDVAFADFLTLSANFGQAGGYTDGNIDLAGNIDFADFLALSDNFGKSAAATAVPEPSAFGIVASGFVALVVLRRRRR